MGTLAHHALLALGILWLLASGGLGGGSFLQVSLHCQACLGHSGHGSHGSGVIYRCIRSLDVENRRLLWILKLLEETKLGPSDAQSVVANAMVSVEVF